MHVGIVPAMASVMMVPLALHVKISIFAAVRQTTREKSAGKYLSWGVDEHVVDGRFPLVENLQHLIESEGCEKKG